jgi:apolipoprotein N-acyltransferase
MLFLVNQKAHSDLGVIMFFIYMFYIFLVGAFIGSLVSFTVRRLRWAAVLLLPVMTETIYFLPTALMGHNSFFIPPPITPASPLIAFPPLIQIASFTGVFGVDFLVLFISSILAVTTQETALRWPWLRRAVGLKSDLEPLPVKNLVAVGGIVLAILFFLGGLFLAGNLEAQKLARNQKNSSKTLTVALLQPNLYLHNVNRGIMKEQSFLGLYRNMLHEASRQQADLIVFPESIWDGSLPTEQRFWDGFRGLVSEIKCFTIAGMLTYTDTTHLYNSWYLLGRHGEILNSYQKRFLIPFGEYIPYRPLVDRLFSWFNRFAIQSFRLLRLVPVTHPGWDDSPGTQEKLFMQDKNRYFVKICDEILFPQFTREGVRLGGEAIFSPSSSDWIGTPLYTQHFLAVACFRAVETRRWIGRTSAGANAYFVDAQGCLRKSSPYNTRAVLICKVPMLDYMTFYVRFGDLFGWSLVFLSFAALAWIARQIVSSRLRKS